MLLRKLIIIILGLIMAVVIIIADNHAHKVHSRDHIFSLFSSQDH
ncbi:hypothetical protein [Pantoea sp. GD03673]|nr:hypothetical protein [Pantoea sp. GD03673]MDH2066995.1 hypothetical protein [Pantoea sp. GD03673]